MDSTKVGECGLFSHSKKDLVVESGRKYGGCSDSKDDSIMDGTKVGGHPTKISPPAGGGEENVSTAHPNKRKNAMAEETKVIHTISYYYLRTCLCYDESYLSPHLYAYYFDFQG